MVLWAILFVVSIFTTPIPYIAPLSFIVVPLIAWDYGVRPALGWVALVHVVIPGVLVLLGMGPFFVFVEARGTVALIMAGSLIAVTALAFLTDRVHSLTKQLRDSRSAVVQANEKLQTALDEVKELRGLLPICAWCKDIRDVSGDWERLELYIARHSRATFTHALCPKCMEKEMHAANCELSGR
jgi:hypothetical protein